MPSAGVYWSSYDSADEAITELEALEKKIFNRDKDAIKRLLYLLAPTACIQEISISSGWGHEFLPIAKALKIALGKLIHKREWQAMITRNMQPQDIPALAELYRQFWGDDSDVAKMKDKFDELHGRDDYIFLCAVENDKVCGSVMGIVCQELYGDCCPFLLVENMVVDCNSRRKGVGKALLTHLEELAKTKDCRQIILVTEANREDACGFYEAVGFHPTANKGFKKKLVNY